METMKITEDTEGAKEGRTRDSVKTQSIQVKLCKEFGGCACEGIILNLKDITA